MNTYRDRPRARRPWVLRPNMVLPESGHVAFDKAGHLFGVRLRTAPVDAHGAVDVRAMVRLVDRQTIFLPCRRGSQRAPDKNTRPFAGHAAGSSG